MRGILAAAVMLVAIGLPALAEDEVRADGANAVLNDPLLDKLVGDWTADGKIAGQVAHHRIEGRWILNHQFLQLHEIGAADPGTGKPEYEALPTIGYDNLSERYVVHWLDVFGGRFSETLGYGIRKGDSEIDFLFEYPDGPFHTDFIYDAKAGRWHWHMTQKGANGKWQEFSDLILLRK